MWKTFQADLKKHSYIRRGRIIPEGTCKKIAAKLGIAMPTQIGMRLTMLAESQGYKRQPGREHGEDNYWSDEDIAPASTQRGKQRTVPSPAPAPPLPPLPPLPQTTKDAFKFTRAEDAAVLGAHLSSNNPEARNLAVDNIARGLNRTQAAVRERIQKLLKRDVRGGGTISSTSSDAGSDSGADDESSAYEQLPPPTRRTTSRSTPLCTEPPTPPTLLRGPPKQRSAPSAGPLKKGPYTEEEDTVIWSAYLSCTTEGERCAALQQAAKQLRRTPSGLQVHVRALLAEQEEGQFEQGSNAPATQQPPARNADYNPKVYGLKEHRITSSAELIAPAEDNRDTILPPFIPNATSQEREQSKPPDTTSQERRPRSSPRPVSLSAPTGTGDTSEWAPSHKPYSGRVTPGQVAAYLHILRPVRAHDQVQHSVHS